MNFWFSTLKPSSSLEFQVVAITKNNKDNLSLPNDQGPAWILLCLILHSNKDSIRSGDSYWKVHPSQQAPDRRIRPLQPQDVTGKRNNSFGSGVKDKHVKVPKVIARILAIITFFPFSPASRQWYFFSRVQWFSSQHHRWTNGHRSSWDSTESSRKLSKSFDQKAHRNYIHIYIYLTTILLGVDTSIGGVSLSATVTWSGSAVVQSCGSQYRKW